MWTVVEVPSSSPLASAMTGMGGSRRESGISSSSLTLFFTFKIEPDDARSGFEFDSGMAALPRSTDAADEGWMDNGPRTGLAPAPVPALAPAPRRTPPGGGRRNPSGRDLVATSTG